VRRPVAGAGAGGRPVPALSGSATDRPGAARTLAPGRAAGVRAGVRAGGRARELHRCRERAAQADRAARAQAHNRGRKHKRRVEVAGARAPRASAHHCVICDITTTSAQHMAMHVAGKAHRRRVATGHMPASVAAAAAALAGAGGDAAAAIAAAGDGSSAGHDSGEGSRGRRAAAGAGPGPGADGLPATAGHAAGAPRPPSADSGSSAGGAGGAGHANGYHGVPNGAAADGREAWSAEGPGHRCA